MPIQSEPFVTTDENGYTYVPLPQGSEVVEKDGETLLRFKVGAEESGADCVVISPGPVSGSEYGRGMRVEVPSVPIMCPPINKPLFDHVTLDPDKAEVEAFVDPRGKEPWQTNMKGSWGGLPAMHNYYAYGLSIIPDASAPRDDVLRLWDTGVVEFRFASRIYSTWPMRECMGDPKELAKLTQEELKFPIVERTQNLVVFGRPLEIVALESWRVRISGAINREKPVSFMVVLHGVAIDGLSRHRARDEVNAKVNAVAEG